MAPYPRNLRAALSFIIAIITTFARDITIIG